MDGEQPGRGSRLSLYLEAMHGSGRGFLLDALVAAAAWAPGLVGMGLRAYWDRLWIAGEGRFAAERGVRILGAEFLRIDDGVFLDRGVYLHGRPGGLTIGAGARVMQGAVLHVFNFRGLGSAGIRIGRRCVLGFNSVITGQGGVELEDDVIVAPGAMILPVDHVHDDPARPIREQGLSARGIRVGRGAWIGAGAVILDGVEIGAGAVVGAGSVVTRDVAAGVVAAGNPAAPVQPAAGRES
jgi:carbonic anhydrase/acetyltransferase-like protein (isoleucine patch superfamily)